MAAACRRVPRFVPWGPKCSESSFRSAADCGTKGGPSKFVALPPFFPCSSVPPSLASLAPVRLRSEGKKMKNDVVALLSLSLSLSLSRWSPRTEVRRRKMSAMGHIKVGRRHEPMTTTARSPATPRHTIERTEDIGDRQGRSFLSFFAVAIKLYISLRLLGVTD